MCSRPQQQQVSIYLHMKEQSLHRINGLSVLLGPQQGPPLTPQQDEWTSTLFTCLSLIESYRWIREDRWGRRDSQRTNLILFCFNVNLLIHGNTVIQLQNVNRLHNCWDTRVLNLQITSGSAQTVSTGQNKLWLFSCLQSLCVTRIQDGYSRFKCFGASSSVL